MHLVSDEFFRGPYQTIYYPVWRLRDNSRTVEEFLDWQNVMMTEYYWGGGVDELPDAFSP